MTEEMTMPLINVACALRNHSACQYPSTCECHCHTGVQTSGRIFTCDRCGQGGLRATELIEHERACGRLKRGLPRPGSVGPCPCECNHGGFCGGCGHTGCGGRR